MKICKGCKQNKPISEFSTRSGRAGYPSSTKRYPRSECKVCRAHKPHNPTESSRARARAYMAANRPRFEKKRLERIYGLSPDEFDELIANQLGLCSVCRTPMRSPHVDHCHTCGKVRGLLCGNCNKAAGLLKDNPDFADSLSRYLRAHSD